MYVEMATEGLRDVKTQIGGGQKYSVHEAFSMSRTAVGCNYVGVEKCHRCGKTANEVECVGTVLAHHKDIESLNGGTRENQCGSQSAH